MSDRGPGRDESPQRRPSLLVDAAVVVAGLLAAGVLGADALSGVDPLVAAAPAVVGAVVGAAAVALVARPAVDRALPDWLFGSLVAVLVILGGGVVLDAVGEPTATFALFGFLVAAGGGLIVRRAIAGRR